MNNDGKEGIKGGRFGGEEGAEVEFGFKLHVVPELVRAAGRIGGEALEVESEDVRRGCNSKALVGARYDGGCGQAPSSASRGETHIARCALVRLKKLRCEVGIEGTANTRVKAIPCIQREGEIEEAIEGRRR